MPSTFKSHVSHYQHVQLGQVEYLNDVADACQNRSKHIALINESFETQNMNNNNTTWEQIRKYVANVATPFCEQRAQPQEHSM